jgi:MFS family permease
MDKFDAQTAHKLFGIIFPLLGLSPAIAPAIGGYITINFLWQSIFMALLILGALLFVGITLGYKETLEPSKKQKNNWANIFKQYKSLSLEPYFMGYIGCLSLASGIYFCYLTVSPFILENLGLTPEKIGLSYIPQTLGFMLGGFFSKKISDRIGTEKLIKYTLYTIVGAAILFAFSMPATSAWNLIIPFIFIATCNGILFPAVMNLILTRYKKISGLAAGFSGFVQGSTAFLATFFAAALTGQSSIKLGIIIVIIAFSSWLCQHLLITKKSIKKTLINASNVK